MLRLAGRRGQALIVKAQSKQLFVARPLSLTSARLAAEDEFRHSEDLAKERYDLRAGEDIERKRSRLVYQSKKRGMLENGVILSSFADKYLNDFDAEQLDQYDRLINLPTNDWDIFYWATKTKPTPPEFETAVMQKLRSHLNKKVSKVNEGASSVAASAAGGANNDDGNDKGNQTDDSGNKEPSGKSILDGRRPDDIVMPAAKRTYELDIDPSSVDLVNYRRDLFDERKMSLRDGSSIDMMTQWRKQFFEKRLRRVIPSPVSVRNLAVDKESPVYTQKSEDKNIAIDKLENADLIDSPAERSMKHHNFVQYLLSHEFTDQLDDYEAEAEAWSNALWLRNYGKSDVTIAPSEMACTKCRSKLHCCDPGLDGYVPREIFATLTNGSSENNNENSDLEVTCQHCEFAENYGVKLSAKLDEKNYIEMLKKFNDMKPSVICLVVDLTDFPNGILTGLVDLIGSRHKLIIVANKIDLLPIDGPNIIDRVTRCVKGNLGKLRPGNKNLYISDIVVLSARTGFGVKTLVSKLATYTEVARDVYIVGSDHSGKSTLFNALLQSDISAVRDVDLLSRLTNEKDILGSGLSMLKFPVNRLEGWEIELKKRRTERVLRNIEPLEQSLVSTTKCRQSTVPHMSMLIDRLEYPVIEGTAAAQSSTAALNKIDSTKASSAPSIVRRRSQLLQESTDVGAVKFSDDHPFQKTKRCDFFSATEENFANFPFLHQTPSLVNSKNQLHDLLTNEERLEVFPHETLVARQYTLRPLQSIFIAGLARLDLLTATSYITVAMFASKYLPIHVISTRKADQFYDTFLGSPYLGVPFGDSPERLKAWPKLVRGESDIHLRRASDIVLSSAGWALVQIGVDQECIVRAWTPEARGIAHRWPPMLAHACKLEWRGKKIRDTPLFRHPNFSIDINQAASFGQ